MTLNSGIYISLVIPAYNEEARLAKTIEESIEYFQTKGWSYEIIVVDDGSTDGTLRSIETICSSNSRVKTIQFKKNAGKGKAVKKGILDASGAYVLFMDADHSVNISNLDIFIKYIDEGYDIAIASIVLNGARIHDANTPLRRMAGSFSKILIRIFAVPTIYDTQRGFKLFTHRAAQSIFSRVTIARWGFDIEALVIASLNGFRIKEIPVHWMNSKRSDIGISDYLVTLFELMRILYNKFLGRYN